ncbi:penicillin-binding protein [Streptomyces uncialis]|uniref:transglycosylase domain-containing protein n=1 Tax=Streptomyces uncialis TaxID=1048205 RepID=UPI00225BA03F|nr:transglycosylase domain-containing protein [Streptomyces uncialis]MCX4664999.1 penicillin-binding protein [Streptomyces uncialis]WTE11953.1 penicillin-binding protein [Streptomyces uncialis]
MSEHRRKPPQPQSGGRAAARRGTSGSSAGRRAAPRNTTESPADSYGPQESGPEDRPYGSRAEARRAAQRTGAGRRRSADGAGRGGSGGGGRRSGGAGDTSGPGRGRGRGPAAKKRFVDYPRSGKYGWRRWVPSWRLVTGTFVSFLGLLMGAAGIAYAMVGVPDEKAAAMAESNVFYWADGSQMASTGGEKNRQNVKFADIPRSMQDAVIAAENATFYQDKGVDPMGIGRAVYNMALGGDTQGGSTITQQYVKNTYLDQSQTVSRKVKELFISIKVGAEVDKEKILTGYLNTAFYGRNAYGIQAASQAYFGVDSKHLTPEQSVFLASVLKGPNLYNPDGGVGAMATPEANRERAEKRWKWIFDRQVEVGRMSAEDREKYTKFPDFVKQKSSLAGQSGYLVDTAKEFVAKKAGLTPEELEKGGYHITTTFQKDKVRELEKAVNATKKDFLDKKKRPKTDDLVQFGAASVDPESGKIVALYGGEGQEAGHYSNNANTTGVPVGSTWKPYVLAAAMKYGTFRSKGVPLSPLTKYNGNDLIVINDQNGDPIKDAKGRPFRQKNESEKVWGDVTLFDAMQDSINTPFVQLGIDVGLSKTRSVTKDLGILESSFDEGNLNNASFSLGTSTPSAIRMASSYGTFANSGKHFEPYSVTEVKHKDKPLPGFEAPKQKRALSAPIADNVTKVLENVVQNGTAKGIKDIGFPVAGKTGTTDKNKSAWFVGYTRELSTAVTLFRTDPKEGKLLSMNGTGGVSSIHGGDIPAELWQDYMAQAMKGVDPQPFPEPGEIGEIFEESPSPLPTPSATKTEEKEPEPTPEPTPSPTKSEVKPSPTPSQTCEPGDWGCGSGSGNGSGENTGGNENEGAENGTTENGGADGGGSDSGGSDNGGGDIGGASPGTSAPGQPGGNANAGNNNGGSANTGNNNGGADNGGLFGGTETP